MPNLLSPEPHTHYHVAGQPQLEQSLSSLEILQDHISRYTSRHLSYDEDILNAFLAIVSRSLVPTFWGIPFVTSDNCNVPETITPRNVELGFLLNLYWDPAHSEEAGCRVFLRREGFPSWSWSGWKGQVRYDPKRREGRRTINFAQCHNMQVGLELPGGKRTSIWNLYHRSGRQNIIPHDTRYLSIHTLVIRLQFDTFGTDPRHIFLCHCHPTSSHPHSGWPQKRWSRPKFCHKRTNDDLRRDMQKQWDCMLLFVENNPLFDGGSTWAFLIIEWNPDRTTAFRVGSFAIEDLPSYNAKPDYPGYKAYRQTVPNFENFAGYNVPRDLIDKVPHSWQSIRLG
ncbi:hypothetical protein V8F20_008803 [Naviculisporaceae sp. PSN 640]